VNESTKLPRFALGSGWKELAFVTVILSILFALVYPLVRPHEEANRRMRAMTESRNLLDNQETAWNAGDLDGFMLGYWNDPELTFYSDNTIEKGYEPLKQRYFKKYKAEGKEMGKLTFSDVESIALRNQGREMAMVRGHWKVEKSKETAEGLFTLWVEKKPEGWRIIHDHSSAAPKP